MTITFFNKWPWNFKSIDYCCESAASFITPPRSGSNNAEIKGLPICFCPFCGEEIIKIPTIEEEK